MREVKLNRLEQVLSNFDYPVSRDTLVSECDDVVLLLADGEIALEAVLENSSDEVFDSADEVVNELMNLLPQQAVGEPYQSEGDA